MTVAITSVSILQVFPSQRSGRSRVILLWVEDRKCCKVLVLPFGAADAFLNLYLVMDEMKPLEQMSHVTNVELNLFWQNATLIFCNMDTKVDKNNPTLPIWLNLAMPMFMVCSVIMSIDSICLPFMLLGWYTIGPIQ